MNLRDAYVSDLRRRLRPKAPLRVVLDGSNGSTGPFLRRIFGNVRGLSVFDIFEDPDGRFPGHGPNPALTHARRALEREVRLRGADLGVIFDADGDRAFFVDDRGRAVYPDDAGYLLARGFEPPYIVDVRTGRRFKKEMLRSNPKLRFFESRVGTYFIKSLMKGKKANFGAENSGHYYFKYKFGKNISYFDSGLRAAVEMINRVSILKKEGKTFSSWLDGLPKLHRTPEDLNLKLKDREHSARVAEHLTKRYRARRPRISYLDGISIEFEEAWFNVRPSNTEPLLRIKLEAVSKTVFIRELKALREAIRKI